MHATTPGIKSTLCNVGSNNFHFKESKTKTLLKVFCAFPDYEMALFTCTRGRNCSVCEDSSTPHNRSWLLPSKKKKKPFKTSPWTSREVTYISPRTSKYILELQVKLSSWSISNPRTRSGCPASPPHGLSPTAPALHLCRASCLLNWISVLLWLKATLSCRAHF